MSNKPARIQRRREAGWSRGNAVIVDRTSRYGNPFRVDGNLVELVDGRTLACGSPSSARRTASNQYEAWLDGEGPDLVAVGGRRFDRRRVLADLHTLRGKDVACPCPLPEKPGDLDHCHGVVLLRRANGAA